MTPQVPHLSPEWPPTSDQLAEIARGAHWEVEQIAYDLAHRPHVLTQQRLNKVAGDLEALAGLLRKHEPSHTR